MNLNLFSEAIEWIEHKSKPIFVLAALVLYVWELIQLAGTISPVNEMGDFLIGALAALSVPFGIILLQEVLELIANLSKSNLLSARHQFEIVLLVIVRSFFKKFAKVSGYVERGEFGEPVQEAVLKMGAIIALMLLIYLWRRMSDSERLQAYRGGQTTNVYKQIMVAALAIFILVNMIFIQKEFDDGQFVQLVFTGIIIIDALFLLLSILREGGFLTLMFESALIIGLIFARFPLFSSNLLSYILSVLGAGLAVAALYVMYRVVLVNENALAESEGHHSKH